MSNIETNPMQSVYANEAEAIGALLGEIENLLRAQRDILRQRGMTLPLGALQKLAEIRQAMDDIGLRLQGRHIEVNRLRALAETSALINSSLGLDEVLNSVIDTVIRLTGAERGYIMLRDEETGEMVFRIARNLNQETIEKGSFIVSQSVVNKVAETGAPVLTTNAQDDPRFANHESVLSYSLLSILCVPLKVKDTVTGVVYADNSIRAGLFAESELELLYAFANQAAIAIENARRTEGVRATLREVTEQQELLENTFASVASGVITTDLHDNIIIYNQAAENIFSIPFDQALNMPLDTALPPLGDEFYERFKAVHQEGSNQEIELAPTINGRGQVYLDMRLSPLKTHEQTTQGVTILIDDLTEMRRREETLKEVERYLPPAMVENIRTIDTIELGGEEREISVVFADVRGFTTFSESLEPEELMTIINRYLSVSSDAVHLYEGIIDKYMGDAVVGIYNTQLNPQDDDHALRAVRAAMSMSYDIQALHETLPKPFRLWFGVGIDTGAAVLGNVGSEDRKEFTALGQPVNYAKRLQEAAEPGEIIISEATYERVHERFDVERIARPLRGEAEPRTMYKVLGFKRRNGE